MFRPFGRNIFLCLLLTFIYSNLIGQLSAANIVQKSIAFHDPNNQWNKAQVLFHLAQKTPDGNRKNRQVTIDNVNGNFTYQYIHDLDTIVHRVVGHTPIELINSSTKLDVALKEELKITPARSKLLKDYYHFLYGLPMKLNESGIRIYPTATDTTFHQKICWKIKVTFDESIGDDVWYFYFDQSNYQMIAYQFYHDESVKDGEYILLDGEQSVQNMIIPKNRSWYYNRDQKYLATDELILASSIKSTLSVN